MDRRESIIPHKLLVDDDRVFKVVPIKCIECDQHVLADRKLTLLC